MEVITVQFVFTSQCRYAFWRHFFTYLPRTGPINPIIPICPYHFVYNDFEVSLNCIYIVSLSHMYA